MPDITHHLSGLGVPEFGGDQKVAGGGADEFGGAAVDADLAGWVGEGGGLGGRGGA